MARIITAIAPHKESITKRKNVAAYARVSSGKDAMLHSLSAQVSYYSELIQSHGDWKYAGVYADEARTGTKDNRPEFQNMLSECEKGSIDMIITKSISRFARNTVTLLETVRRLKELNVDVYFEEQNIHSLSGDGELMLTILASFAQEESLSVSENCKWRIRNKFKEGMPNTFSLYGYENKNGVISIDEEKANVVKTIFEWYLSGIGTITIANNLTEEGIASPKNTAWCKQSVTGILRNVKYTGNLLLQRYYTKDHLSKATLFNKGELPKYYVENTHDAIISENDFIKVQEMFASHHVPKEREYEFKGKVFCGKCGNRYSRKKNYKKYVWRCNTIHTKDSASCLAKQVLDSVLVEVAAKYQKEISKIIVFPDQRLKLIFADKSETEETWTMPSRKWTEEMKSENYDKLRRRYKS